MALKASVMNQSRGKLGEAIFRRWYAETFGRTLGPDNREYYDAVDRDIKFEIKTSEPQYPVSVSFSVHEFKKSQAQVWVHVDVDDVIVDWWTLKDHIMKSSRPISSTCYVSEPTERFPISDLVEFIRTW